MSIPDRQTQRQRHREGRFRIRPAEAAIAIRRAAPDDEYLKQYAKTVELLITEDTLESREQAHQFCQYLKKETDLKVPSGVWDYFEERPY